jgi:hypothetical protein
MLHRALCIQMIIRSEWLDHDLCGILPIYINSNLFLISDLCAILIMLIIVIILLD